ncbi:MAG: 50S ribosomal protein L10, partial [Candidatus Aminicenantes bacterium]|nr:50S ribosomal protein L10 [Candidatus Aminicenantes bacterium]
MSVKRKIKEQMVKELSDNFTANHSFYLVDFINMPVYQAVELRREMRKNDYQLKVVKNRLALRALKEDFPDELKNSFQGPTALAFSVDDPVGLARLIKNFSSQYKILKVKAGMVEGRYLPEDEFNTIANLTSREDLLAKLAYLMAFPLSKLLRT